MHEREGPTDLTSRPCDLAEEELCKDVDRSTFQGHDPSTEVWLAGKFPVHPHIVMRICTLVSISHMLTKVIIPFNIYTTNFFFVAAEARSVAPISF